VRELLFDTHLLLWIVTNAPQLPQEVRDILEDGEDVVFFSAASIQEVAIKYGLGKADFTVHPRLLRDTLLRDGYNELPVRSRHAVEVMQLPPTSAAPMGHKDPFDRLLIAQAQAETMVLVTSDAAVAAYSSDICFYAKAT
jgi:PIN domain nuclease of toxin-antitoxin system